MASIAEMFGLSANIVPHDTVWPTIQMAGMTYWQFCVMLAERIRYTFYCSGVALVFKPRQTDPRNVKGLTATYDYKYNPGGLPVFSPVLGATSPMGGRLANRQLAGIESRVRNKRCTPRFQVAQTRQCWEKRRKRLCLRRRALHCSFAGRGGCEGGWRRFAQSVLYLTSTAVAGGDPLISQGSLVYVCNANGSQNGLWFVQKVNHCITRETYSMDMHVGRDSLGATPIVVGPMQTMSPPTAALTNGKASSMMDVYGFYRGICTTNTDPEGLYRIKATVPQVFGDATVETDWAWPCFAPTFLGSYTLPVPGAGVWITFEGGDTDYPIWVGVWK